jgi:hypothetical protein
MAWRGQQRFTAMCAATLIAGACLCCGPKAAAFDAEAACAKDAIVISADSSLAHFGGRLGATFVQAWNLQARISLLPFGALHYHHFGGVLDGCPEVGIQPVYEQFSSIDRNFGGLGLALRYHLFHFRYGRLVPWISASIAPGYTDLNIGRVSNETRLKGPFMNLIEGGVGEEYFVTEHTSLYLGLQAQHISNAGLDGSNQNYALNTPWGVVFGLSFFLR